MNKLLLREAGLIVARQAIAPELARCFAAESIPRFASKICLINLGIKEGQQSATYVTSRNFKLRSLLEEEGKPATKAALGCVIKQPGNLTLTMNYQSPSGEQGFHQDDSDEPVYILHGSDKGAFECSLSATSPEEAATDPEKVCLELGAGDLVIQLRPYLFHRGANLDPVNPRISAAIGQLKETTPLR